MTTLPSEKPKSWDDPRKSVNSLLNRSPKILKYIIIGVHLVSDKLSGNWGQNISD